MMNDNTIKTLHDFYVMATKDTGWFDVRSALLDLELGEWYIGDDKKPVFQLTVEGKRLRAQKVY